jgi:hypothetical protein
MPCGYEWPTIQVEFQYGKSEPWNPPGWPFKENLGHPLLTQKSASVSFSPVPSRWYQDNFCGWIDVQQGVSAEVAMKYFYMPGPLFLCPQDNPRVLGVRAENGSSVFVGMGSGLSGVSGQSKADWLSYCQGQGGSYTDCSLTGFDFQDWRWECDKFVIGSFTRSRKFTLPGRDESYRGFNYTIPSSSFIDSITVTVPNQ